jgi:hypothetical protein
MSEPKKIDAIYCYVLDEEDGGEGIPAVQTPDGAWMPMVAGDIERLESLKPLAQTFANKLQKPIRLVKFTNKELINEIKPSLVMRATKPS